MEELVVGICICLMSVEHPFLLRLRNTFVAIIFKFGGGAASVVLKNKMDLVNKINKRR
jgi:hypothetical protein